MLKNVPKLLSPELLKVLCEMGHGDEIIIGDGNFPAASNAKRLVRADGLGAAALLDAILAVLPLDQYDANNFVLMAKPDSDPADVSIWETYKATLHKYEPDAVVSYEERFAFYERARKAYAVVATGEEKQYANIILKKGCVL